MNIAIPFRPKLFETIKKYSGERFRRVFGAGVNVMVMAFPLSVAFASAFVVITYSIRQRFGPDGVLIFRGTKRPFTRTSSGKTLKNGFSVRAREITGLSGGAESQSAHRIWSSICACLDP